MTAANNTEDLPTEGEPPADGSGTATIVEYTPDRVRIDTDGNGGVLVLTDTWAPGWQAAVDGVPTPIHRVDGAFRGVAVKDGAHEIVFRYVSVADHDGAGVVRSDDRGDPSQRLRCVPLAGMEHSRPRRLTSPPPLVGTALPVGERLSGI